MDQPHNGSFGLRKEGGSGTGCNVDELQKHAKGTRSGRNGHTVRDSFLAEHPEEAEAASSQGAARPGQGVAGTACSLGVGLLRGDALKLERQDVMHALTATKLFTLTWLVVRA